MESKQLLMEYMSLWTEMHSKEVTPTLAEAYWRSLKGHSGEDCRAAFEKCTDECEWFPKIPEIKRALPGNASAGDKAVLAWVEVDKAVRTIGNYQSVRFSDPVTHSVIQAMGGWSYLCSLTTEEYKWKRVEFEKLYPTMAAKGGHEQYLQGDCEQSQRLNDRADWVKPVAQVGGVKKDNKLLTEGE